MIFCGGREDFFLHFEQRSRSRAFRVGSVAQKTPAPQACFLFINFAKIRHFQIHKLFLSESLSLTISSPKKRSHGPFTLGHSYEAIIT